MKLFWTGVEAQSNCIPCVIGKKDGRSEDRPPSARAQAGRGGEGTCASDGVPILRTADQPAGERPARQWIRIDPVFAAALVGDGYVVADATAEPGDGAAAEPGSRSGDEPDAANPSVTAGAQVAPNPVGGNEAAADDPGAARANTAAIWGGYGLDRRRLRRGGRRLAGWHEPGRSGGRAGLDRVATRRCGWGGRLGNKRARFCGVGADRLSKSGQAEGGGEGGGPDLHGSKSLARIDGIKFGAEIGIPRLNRS